MVRILLLSAGGRGDVEPFCAIARHLLNGGCSPRPSPSVSLQENKQIFVDFFVQADFMCLAQPFQCHPNFRLFSFPFTSNDFNMTSKEHPLSDLEHPDPRMKNVGTLAEIIGRLILPCMGQVLDVLENSDVKNTSVIITSAFTRPLALLLAHHRTTVRVIVLHLQPLLPNGLFPSYRTHRSEFVQRCLALTTSDILQSGSVEMNHGYEDSYWMIEEALEGFFLTKRMVEVCEKTLGGNVKPYNFEVLQ